MNQTYFRKNDSLLHILPLNAGLNTQHLDLQKPSNFRFSRRTFIVDVLTIPFKNPAISGVELQQLTLGFFRQLHYF